MANGQITAVAAPPLVPGTSPDRSRLQIGLYFGLLTLASGLGHPAGLLRLPLQFWLKDNLDVSPQGLAMFEAVVFAPVFVAFAFGFLRDHWRPFRSGDRGYLMFSGLAGIACYLWLAAGEASYYRLIAGVLLAVSAFQLMNAAGEALMAWVARRNLMTGRLNALNEFGDAIVGVFAALLGGWLATRASMQVIFLFAAGCTAAVVLQAFWRPKAIFSTQETVKRGEGMQSVLLLLRNRNLRPILLVIVLWSFSPGWHTPLLFYLTDDVKISTEAYGICQAMDYVGITLASIGYFWLCIRIRLKHLLWWGIVLNIMPGVLFLWVKDAPQAIAASLVIWLLMGFLNTAIGDLLTRACPEGLEGSCQMLGASAFIIAGTIGDLIGAWLYETGGLIPCIVIEALFTLAIIPVLRRLPVSLVASREAEPAGS
jgi:MFS family permease